MRRSICNSEPSQALAGQRNTWKFSYTTAAALPKGTLMRFDLMSDGREIDWEIPDTSLKKVKNVIYAQLENGKTLGAKEIDIPDRYVPQYEFVLPEKVESGETVSIIVGAAKNLEKNHEKNGNHTQTYSQRRRQFNLYLDTTGKGQFADPEIFSIDIKGNALHTIRVLTPSFVTRNKRFDVIVRFEDEFGNLTSNASDETLVELSYENLRENLNWKLFVPETGFISLPNLYFNEVGVYTIQLLNTFTNETFRSFPIKCFNENEKNLFWGLLHGESERIDSTENIESCLRHFRDEKAMNFYCSSPSEDLDETPNDIWKLITQNIADFEEADRFITMLGFQWQGNKGTEGIRQFIWAKDNKPILRKKDTKYNTLKKLYKNFSPKDLISIPCFTMGKGMEFNFKDLNPEFERVVEIYNSWGSSECTKNEGNTRPIKGPARKGVQESAEGSIQKALQSNKRFGFVAGGLDDRGPYYDFYEDGQEQYSPGLTAITAPEQSRSALFDALYNRSCYATTGARIILGIDLSGTPMGGETSSAEKHGLLINRHVSGYVAGTDTIKTVEIIRNGKTIQTFKPDGYHFEFTYDDMTPLEKVSINAKDKNPPFSYYYLRVTQKDGHMAWSSPIWIDCIKSKPVKKKQPVKSSKKTTVRLDDLDDDDDEELDAIDE